MKNETIFTQLRKQHQLTQDQLAEKLCISRQAVSRWETGETLPNPETLKQLSKLYDVSINALLGSPRQLICQCCGMPLTEEILSREPDGTINEDYCQWCYAEGKFTYLTLQDLIDFCAPYMASTMPGAKEAEIRTMLEQQLPQLSHWKAQAASK